MTVTSPISLLLLLLLIPIIYIGWPRNRFRRLRDSASLLLRVTIVTLLVFALAGAQVVQSADRLSVVFLVDVSDSMGTTAQEAALEYIREALPEMQPDDVAGVVAFGADAQVARSVNEARELGPMRATPDSSNTNLAAAIRLGLALFPGDTARRMVVLSDGQPTIGDTEGAAQLAAAAGVEISYVPFTRPPVPEIQVRNVDVPPVVEENQEFDLTVTIASDQDTQAEVTILAAGEIVTRQPVDLREGVNNYTLRLQSGATGFRDLQVTVDPLDADGFYQNNSLGAFTRVEGPSRVLVVSDDADGANDEARYLLPALQETGLQVDLVTPTQLPIGVGTLAQYDSVVLVNVPAVNLSNRRMEVLESYVSDLGGGLVVVGGPDAYGPGGYFQTPLEDALPVEVQIKDQQRLPQLTIAYVIDRSGSMGAVGSSGIPNIELAKEAIIRSIDFLQPTDRAGITSFDTDAYWIAPFQDVLNRRELQRLVATLRPSGGTSIMAGMRLVARDIVIEPSRLKHIILLTDGGADPSNLVELTRQLNEEAEVTTSVISIGSFEAGFLQTMAQVGQGNYHNVPDAESIPTIFAQETVLATRTYIQEEEFAPIQTARHPIMDSFNAVPTLRGYVAATSRPTAQTILRGPDPHNDPILAAWQYGLGRSVAFMSDATARWGQNWVTWNDFATFWSQAVRWTITEGASNNLETRIVRENGQARIIVDARQDDGAFLNGLDLQASVVHPDPQQGASRVRLRQVAPGRYEGIFTPSDEGAYFLRVTNQQAGESGEPTEDNPLLNQTTGWVMSYSPEYNVRETDDTLLASIADLTGGGDLSENPTAVFAHNIRTQDATVPLWPWLLLAAMVLLPFDVTVRRLLVTRGDLRRLSTYLSGKVSQGRELAAAPSARMTSLREARDRARQRTGHGAEPEEAGVATTINRLRERRQQQEVEQPEAGPTEQPTAPPRPRYTPSTEEKRPAPEEEEEVGNIGARLLRRRRETQRETEQEE